MREEMIWGNCNSWTNGGAPFSQGANSVKVVTLGDKERTLPRNEGAT